MQNLITKHRKFLFNGLLISMMGFSFYIIAQKEKFKIAPKVMSFCDTCTYKSLGIKNIPQQSDVWCWAASVQMVIKHLKKTEVSQCEIATERVRLNNPSVAFRDACNSLPDTCNYSTNNVDEITWTTYFNPLPDMVPDTGKKFNNMCRTNPQTNIDVLSAILNVYGLKVTIIPKNCNTLKRIKNILCKGIPIIGLYGKNDYSSHVVVIDGFQKIDNINYLFINNPLYDKTANCYSCFHVIQTNDNGDNELSYLDGGSGTFCAIAYLAITKKPNIKDYPPHIGYMPKKYYN